MGSSFRKENRLKGRRYEKQIDLELYQQMVNMIFKLSVKKEKEKVLWQIKHTSLFWELPAQTMEQVYGLHYPGEVLERLKEKTELTLPKIRALSLALGQTKEIHEDGMFLGTQFTQFCQKTFRNLKYTDCYLLVAKYLLEEKGKKQAYKTILEYPWKKIEEILFVLSMLPDDTQLWEQLKGNLNQCFGKQRVLDVYEDGELYIWICKHCAAKLRGYRKKDLDALKYITRLPDEPARNGNVMQEKMKELGYTLPEIHYLNGIFAIEPNIGNLKYSITSERIAVEVCKFFMNEERVYSESVYELCKELIDTYKSFEIKLEGTDGILQYMKNIIQLKNVRTYQLLFPYKNEIYNSYYNDEEVNFYINLIDPRWDPLYTWLDKKEFVWLITKTISCKGYTDEELRQFLDRYKTLTGEMYEEIFWRQEWNMEWGRAFCRLSEANILNPLDLMTEYVKQLEDNEERTKEKWEYMFSFLLEYMKRIGSPEAFQMLTIYMKGKERLEESELTEEKKLMFESFGIRDWKGSGERFENLNFLRLFLTSEEHEILFHWLDVMVFKCIPEEYLDFLVTVLNHPDTLLWMKEEEAREICFRILPLIEDCFTKKRLQKRYMSKEAFEYLEQMEEERKRRKKILEEKRIYQKLKQEFTKLVARKEAEGKFQPAFEFLEKYRYPMWKKAETIVAGYLSDICGSERNLNISKKELLELLRLELNLINDKLLDMDTIRNTILGYKEEIDA